MNFWPDFKTKANGLQEKVFSLQGAEDTTFASRKAAKGAKINWGVKAVTTQQESFCLANFAPWREPILGAHCKGGMGHKHFGGSAWESNPPGTPLSAPHWI